MTHSRIPKFTKLRPFGVPQTPFNPKSGKYVALGNEQWIIRVVVERKIEGSEHLYVCSVIDERGGKSGEQVHAHRLVLSYSAVEEIAAETVTFAYYIDKKWWIRGEEESTYAYVDFLVEEFDRTDADGIGDYWLNNQKWSIRNQRGYESGSSSVASGSNAGYLSSLARITNLGPGIIWTTVDPAYGISREYYHSAQFFIEDAETVIDVLYKAVLSNANHNIKIVANCSLLSGLSYYDNYLVSVNFEFCTHIPSEFQERGTRILMAAGNRSSLTCEANSATATGYFNPSYGCTHGGTHHHSHSKASQSIPARQMFYVRAKNNDLSASYTISDVVSVDYEEDEYDEQLITYCNAGVHQAYSGIQVRRIRSDLSSGHGDLGLSEGENTFYFEVRDGFISGWCNGNQIFKNQSLYTLSAGMFGLRGDWNMLTLHQTGEGENYISRVKVWTADVPEPPDGESGHGTYDDGQSRFNYADKYHAGGDYNPDA